VPYFRLNSVTQLPDMSLNTNYVYFLQQVHIKDAGVIPNGRVYLCGVEYCEELTLSEPMSDLVRHYDFPVPDRFLDL
jgi:hypothetical protein